jgi:uncharacterized protein YkwD
MKNLKQITKVSLVILLLVFTSCSKEDINDTDLNNGEFVKFYPNKHTSFGTMEANILHYVNEQRKDLGLANLVSDATIKKYVDSHNEYLIQNDVLNHYNFKNRAISLSKEMNGRGVGENVARFQKTAYKVYHQWMASEQHKANIENPKWTKTAISSKRDDNGRYYFTQIFLEK